jgi:hypothetical protein
MAAVLPGESGELDIAKPAMTASRPSAILLLIELLSDGGSLAQLELGEAESAPTVGGADEVRRRSTQVGSMTRFAAILLSLSFAAGGAFAASPEAAYSRGARQGHRGGHGARSGNGERERNPRGGGEGGRRSSEAAQEHCSAGCSQGLSPTDKLNLALSQHEEEFGDLDGLTSYSEGQDMVVTTRQLLMVWQESAAKDEVKERRLPTGVDAAVRRDGFYTFSVGEDSVFAKFSDLPAMKPPGADLAIGASSYFRCHHRDRHQGRSGLRRQHPPQASDP